MHTSTFLSNYKNIILGCIFLIICNVLYAQKNDANKIVTNNNWSINLNAGSTQYWGYLNSTGIKSSLKHAPTWGYGFVITNQITHVIGFRGQFLMGKIKGRKDVFSDGSPANLLYFSDFAEQNLTVKVSLTNMIKGYKPNRMLNIYGLAGIGLTHSQGQTTNYLTYKIESDWGYKQGRGINGYELEGLGTAGIGVSLKLSNELDFTFENSMKFTKRNKLDEINGFLNSDAFGYSSIGLSYNFRFKKDEKKALVVETIIQEKPKPVTTELKPVEVKKEVVSTPAPAKEVQKSTFVETVKQPEENPVERVVLFSGYKVQIQASITPDSFDNIMKQYNLTEQIREDHTNKWYRYSVGEYSTYKEANAYRKILNTRNKLTGTFIVKIEDGKRVGPVGK